MPDTTRGPTSHPLDFYVAYDNSEVKAGVPETISLFERLIKSIKSFGGVNQTFTKDVTSAAVGMDKLAAATGGMFSKFKSGAEIPKLFEEMGKIRKADMLRSAGIMSDPGEIRKITRDSATQYRSIRDNLIKEIRSTGGNIFDHIDELASLKGLAEEAQSLGSSIANDPNNPLSHSFWEKHRVAVTLSLAAFRELSQQMRSVYGPQEAAGVLSAQMGGSLNQGRGSIAGIMSRGGMGVGIGEATDAFTALTRAGFEDQDVNGSLGAATAALQKRRGVSAGSIAQLADTLRSAGMPTDQIVQFLGTVGKRSRFGQAAVTGVSGALESALPYLQQKGIDVGTAAESLSRLQESMTRGFGMGARGAQMAGQFTSRIGSLAGNPTGPEMISLAGIGIHAEDIAAAMRGDLKPLLGKLNNLKNASTFQKQAVSKVFGWDVNQLSSMMTRAGRFTEDGIEAPARNASDALEGLKDGAEKATNALQQIGNMISRGATGVNSATGGMAGQLFSSGAIEQTLNLLLMGRLLRSGNLGMGMSGRGLLPAMLGNGGVGVGLGGPMIPGPGGMMPLNRAARMGAKGTGGWMGRAGSIAGKAAMGVGFGLSAGEGIYNTVTGQGDPLNNTLMGVGGSLGLLGMGLSATGIGAGLGVPLMAIGGIMSLAGALLPPHETGGTGSASQASAQVPGAQRVTVSDPEGTAAVVRAIERMDKTLRQRMTSDGFVGVRVS